jgi:NAD dependent epimerase/dehydratase
MTFHGRSVLVTGAGGFIGSHLAERLVESGAKVRALVRYNGRGDEGWLGTSKARQDMTVIAGDITDRECVEAAMEDVEVVFHLAALIAIPYSYQCPESYIRTNVGGTLNVLLAAKRQGGTKVVHTSTSEVYGTAQYVPIDEAHPLQGQSPYSASKIGADKLAESFHLSFRLPVITVRPFNTYGPRQSARAIIPTILSQALAGQVVRLGNLLPTRDLNYVSDTVEGFLKAAEVEGAVGRTINLGSGREISIGDLAALLGQISGREINIVEDADRVRPEGSEVERLLADASRAKALLDWEPRVTLEEGLAQTLAWMEREAHRYRAGEYAV